jgi:hypothetical protein
VAFLFVIRRASARNAASHVAVNKTFDSAWKESENLFALSAATSRDDHAMTIYEPNQQPMY